MSSSLASTASVCSPTQSIHLLFGLPHCLWPITFLFHYLTSLLFFSLQHMPHRWQTSFSQLPYQFSNSDSLSDVFFPYLFQPCSPQWNASYVYVWNSCSIFCLEFLPATVLLPPKRLESLLCQAIELQKSDCIYHNTTMDADLTSYSLLTDHQCDRYASQQDIDVVVRAFHLSYLFV